MRARYVIGRILRALLTVAFVATFVFGIVHFLPGDPADVILGDQASPEDRAALRRALHLDESLPRQFARFVGSIFDGTLGTSFRRHPEPVAPLILAAMPPTALLALSSLALAWAL